LVYDVVSPGYFLCTVVNCGICGAGHCGKTAYPSRINLAIDAAAVAFGDFAFVFLGSA